MAGVDDIVITGLGCVTPLGIGRQALRDSLLEGRCATSERITLHDSDATTCYTIGIPEFDGRKYVTPRKALKVMSREVQMAYAAAHLAWLDAGLEGVETDPDRKGVIYGAEVITGDELELLGAVDACRENGQLLHEKWGQEFARQIYPLWMLKNLPNMPACHVGIALDARGPNNTITQEEVSGLLALFEAATIIERGDADWMVVGGIGSRISPTRLVFRVGRIYDQHQLAENGMDTIRCLPFSPTRRGIVPAEGAGAIVLERRSEAVKRGATILGRLAGRASRCAEPTQAYGGSRQAIAAAARGASVGCRIEPGGHKPCLRPGLFRVATWTSKKVRPLREVLGSRLQSAHTPAILVRPELLVVFLELVYQLAGHARWKAR